MKMFATRTDWPLTPNRLSLAIEERRQRGQPILDLTESNPTRCGFDYSAAEILSALADPSALDYSPDPRGMLSARLAVVDYYKERGVSLDHQQVFLTTSTSEAYAFVFRLLADPGDNILSPVPSYPLFDYLARLNDVELAPYSLVYDDGWEMDGRDIESNINSRTRAILLVHPNNPTGSFVRRHELDSLIRLAKAHSLALIADEVFLDYVFESNDGAPQRVTSHAAVTGALTFTLSGLSKISALPQMKLAWVAVNGPSPLLKDALSRLELIADTYLSVAAPLARALPKLLATRRAIQPQIHARLSKNLEWLDRQLELQSLVRRLKVASGWYVILKMPAFLGDDDWALELLCRDGVLTHPGHFYEFHQDGHLVISLLTPPEGFKRGVSYLLARACQTGGAAEE